MAERNAAVARASEIFAWHGLTNELEKIPARSKSVAEGQRQATAAIVAHVRACAASFEAAAKSSANAGMRDHLAYAGDACFRYRALADAIEAGDHLPSAGDGPATLATTMTIHRGDYGTILPSAGDAGEGA